MEMLRAGGFLGPPLPKRKFLNEGCHPIDADGNGSWMEDRDKLAELEKGDEPSCKRIERAPEQGMLLKQSARRSPHSFQGDSMRKRGSSTIPLVNPIYGDQYLNAIQNISHVSSIEAGMGKLKECRQNTCWFSKPQSFEVDQNSTSIIQDLPPDATSKYQNIQPEESCGRSNFNEKAGSNVPIPGSSVPENNWLSNSPASKCISSLGNTSRCQLMADFRLINVTPKFVGEDADATFFPLDNIDLVPPTFTTEQNHKTTKSSTTTSSSIFANSQHLAEMNPPSGAAPDASRVASSSSPLGQLSTPTAQLTANIPGLILNPGPVLRGIGFPSPMEEDLLNHPWVLEHITEQEPVDFGARRRIASNVANPPLLDQNPAILQMTINRSQGLQPQKPQTYRHTTTGGVSAIANASVTNGHSKVLMDLESANRDVRNDNWHHADQNMGFSSETEQKSRMYSLPRSYGDGTPITPLSVTSPVTSASLTIGSLTTIPDAPSVVIPNGSVSSDIVTASSFGKHEVVDAQVHPSRVIFNVDTGSAHHFRLRTERDHRAVGRNVVETHRIPAPTAATSLAFSMQKCGSTSSPAADGSQASGQTCNARINVSKTLDALFLGRAQMTYPSAPTIPENWESRNFQSRPSIPETSNPDSSLPLDGYRNGPDRRQDYNNYVSTLMARHGAVIESNRKLQALLELRNDRALIPQPTFASTSTVEHVGNRESSVPMFRPGNLTNVKGLREVLAAYRQFGHSSRTELKDITFYEHTPQKQQISRKAQIHEHTNQFVVNYAGDGMTVSGKTVDVGRGGTGANQRCVMYQVDIPTAPGSNQTIRWIYFLISRTMMSFHNVPVPGAHPLQIQECQSIPLPSNVPKNFLPRAASTSWVVFAAPMECVHEIGASKETPFWDVAEENREKVEGRKVEFQYSFGGVPSFEFSDKEAVEMRLMLCGVQDEDINMTRGEWLSVDGAQEILRSGDESSSSNMYHNADYENEVSWFQHFQRLKEFDASRWRYIREMMARGSCRIVARYEQRKDPKGKREQ